VAEQSESRVQSLGAKVAEKLGDKVVDWLWLALLPLAGAAALFARRWIAEEWACIKKPYCAVQGWSLGLLILAFLAVLGIVTFLAIKLLRSRRDLGRKQHELELRIAREAMLVSSNPPPFKPITVEDERLKLRWFIRKSPDGWLHWRKIDTTVDPAFMRETLDGPFHAVPGCNGPLAENWLYTSDGSSRQPVFTGQCQTCSVKIFQGFTVDGRRSGSVPAWPVCAQALEELQRMHRNGAAFNGETITLEKPTYWKAMVPPELSTP
jgi:hypothetical protein